jgi:hypothetical protein
MKQLVYVTLLLLVCACNEKVRQDEPQSNPQNVVTDSVEVVNNPQTNLNIQMNNFTEIDSSAVLIFPLHAKEKEDANGSIRSYKEMPENEYWNITFLNTKTNEAHLLSESKMLIKNYNYNEEAYEKAKMLRNKIFYTIRTDDINKDKLLNDSDPLYLFVSDKKGYNFKQISPSNLNFKKWEYIDSSNKIILTLQKDSNKDNEFDEKDETVMYDVDAFLEKEAKEVFSIVFKNKLKVLFDRDWKSVKK